MRSEPGAPAAAGFIPLTVPVLAGREWEYVKQCLDTGWVSSVGSFVDRFEHDLAAYVGARHAVAVVNGTSAIHIALMLVGVREGDEVVVPALTFIAPVNAVRYCGAHPVFIDAEADHAQMDVSLVAEFLRNQCERREGGCFNRATGRRVAAIVPVHVLGHPVDMDPLLATARDFGIPVIEDATESLGSLYKGRPTGTMGGIGCFSFNGNKIITTGGGGMIVTSNESWAKKAKYLTTQAKDDPVEYVHHEVGFNYRLTNVQAAIGCAQLEQLPGFVAEKQRIASVYEAAFRSVPGLRLLTDASWAKGNAWLSTVVVDAKVFGVDSRGLLKRLESKKAQARPLWRPIHMNRPYEGYRSNCPVAEALYRDALSLPCTPGLTVVDQARVIETILEGNGHE